MAFVSDPDLKWDIFLSYAHVDNAEGWVDRFHKKLAVKLDQLGGRAGEIRTWRDPQTDEATIFDDVIRSRVQQSALFLALCSHGYRRSDYCREEFDAFRQHFGDAGLRVGDRSRIVRVRLHNIRYDDLPGTDDRTGAFDFFAAVGDDPIGTPLETDSPDFRDRLQHLSRFVYRILDDMRQAKRLGLVESRRLIRDVPSVGGASGTKQRGRTGAVFLSYAREDLERVKVLARALEAQGWSVWWDAEIPAGSTFRTVITQALENACCVVVAWSKTSITHRWVIEEAQDALDRGILVPVFLDQVRPPLGFREVQGAKLIAWGGDASDVLFQRLAADIRSRLGT